MVAAYAVNEGVSAIAANEDVQEILGDGVDILKMTLKDYKEKLSEEVAE